MEKEEIKKEIVKRKSIAVVRLKEIDSLLGVVSAIAEGGVTSIELTMTIPNAFAAIERVAKEFGNNVVLGVGSVTTAEMALKAIDSGAVFVVSPIYKKSIVDAVLEKGNVVIPGTFTPTEMQTAYENGADFLKLFPADCLGMDFIKGVKAPLPHLQIIPTGGVSLTNANEWIKAGASAVGIGSALLDKKAIETKNFSKLTENARILSDNLKG